MSRNPIQAHRYFNKLRSRSRIFKTAATAALAVSLLSGCSLLPAEEQALAPPLVKPKQEVFDVVEVKKGNIQTFLKGNATFVATTSETLSFKESGGRIETIHARLGQEVNPGDLLIELETGDLKLQAKLQRLNVERVEIQYNDAIRSGANSSELRLHEIDLERERISLEAIESNIAASKLVSPIHGIVTYLADMKSGDGVTAYSPLVGIADPSDLKLTYQAISSKDLLPVEPKMAGKVTYKGKEYPAKVLQTPSSAPVTSDKALQERNNTALIIGVDKLPKGIEIGENADFIIPLQKRDNVIVLPRAGVRSYLGRDYVQVAEGERRKEVDVEIGLRTQTEVEIVRGLEEGQQVILNN